MACFREASLEPVGDPGPFMDKFTEYLIGAIVCCMSDLTLLRVCRRRRARRLRYSHRHDRTLTSE